MHFVSTFVCLRFTRSDTRVVNCLGEHFALHEWQPLISSPECSNKGEERSYCYYYATMSPAGMQGAVRSRQVHQLTQVTDVGCGLPNAI